jgi:hypothetical protein
MEVQKQQSFGDESQVAGPYEAPRIEVVLTAEELEREVLYAGLTPV